MLWAMEPTTRVHLPPTPACLAAVHVVRTLQAAGFSAYLVGGCVRDVLLGEAPKDFDVATEAHPPDVRRLFVHVVEVGAAFGVLRVHQRDASGQLHEVEVATFRAESDYRDGRRPDNVRFTDAREDVRRRDFSINGLLCDPLDVVDGQAAVVDWVGGLHDLRHGVLRAIGAPPERFAEDALRMLRAPRFAARFNLALDPATAAAIGEAASTLARVSAERVRDELARMLVPPTADRALAMLDALGLMAVLFPDLAAHDPQLTTTRARFSRLHDAVAATERPRDGHFAPDTAVDFPLALALLLHPVRAAWPEPRVTLALKMSGAELKRLAHLWQISAALDTPLPTPDAVARTPAWMRLLRQADADGALLLRLALGDPSAAALRDLRRNTPIRHWQPTPALTGHDLSAAGHAPGPHFARALAAAEDAQLLGQNESTARSIAFALLTNKA